MTHIHNYERSCRRCGWHSGPYGSDRRARIAVLLHRLGFAHGHSCVHDESCGPVELPSAPTLISGADGPTAGESR